MNRLKVFLFNAIEKILSFIWTMGFVNLISFPLITFVISIFSNEYSSILKQYIQTLAGIWIVPTLAMAILYGIHGSFFTKREPDLKECSKPKILFNQNSPSNKTILLCLLVMTALPPAAILGWHEYYHQKPNIERTTQKSGTTHFYDIKPHPQPPTKIYTETTPKTRATSSKSLYNGNQSKSESPQTAYIGNRKSHIFHYPGCRAVLKMNPSNMVDFESRNNATTAGYRPCRICYP